MHKTRIKRIFYLEEMELSIHLDKNSNLFWSYPQGKILPLSDMPRKIQIAFFLTFLHREELSEKFKDMAILGAIDLYIKNSFYNGHPLLLDS